MKRRIKLTTTVLLVDDERTQRKKVRQILHPEGYRVVESADCNHAVATFEKYRDDISLLLTDISLSDGNGCDLAITLQKRKPSLRALFVSGGVGSEFCRFYGLDMAGLHFLAKPFLATELAARVRQVIRTAAVQLHRASVPKTLSASGNPAY